MPHITQVSFLLQKKDRNPPSNSSLSVICPERHHLLKKLVAITPRFFFLKKATVYLK